MRLNETDDDPLGFDAAIKSTERARVAFPLIMLVAIVLFSWRFDAPLFAQTLTSGEVLVLVMFIALLYLVNQVAEFRLLYLRNERRKYRQGR